MGHRARDSGAATPQYTFDGSAITLTGLSDPTDCVASALAENKISLDSVVYDAGDDSITVKMTIQGLFLFTMELDKSA